MLFAFGRVDDVFDGQQAGDVACLLAVQRRQRTNIVFVSNRGAFDVYANRTPRPTLVVLATVAVGVQMDCFECGRGL